MEEHIGKTINLSYIIPTKYVHSMHKQTVDLDQPKIGFTELSVCPNHGRFRFDCFGSKSAIREEHKIWMKTG
jgi:hypothetical protein